MTWGWAILGGLLGAGITVGVLATRKSRELEVRGLAIRQNLEMRGDAMTSYLLSKGQGIGPEIAQLALQGSERTATYHMATRYGLTPDLVARLQQLPRLP